MNSKRLEFSRRLQSLSAEMGEARLDDGAAVASLLAGMLILGNEARLKAMIGVLAKSVRAEVRELRMSLEG